MTLSSSQYRGRNLSLTKLGIRGGVAVLEAGAGWGLFGCILILMYSFFLFFLPLW